MPIGVNFGCDFLFSIIIITIKNITITSTIKASTTRAIDIPTIAPFEDPANDSLFDWSWEEIKVEITEEVTEEVTVSEENDSTDEVVNFEFNESVTIAIEIGNETPDIPQPQNTSMLTVAVMLPNVRFPDISHTILSISQLITLHCAKFWSVNVTLLQEHW